MTWEEYVDLLADLLSGDSDRVHQANLRLFKLVVDGEDTRLPALALVDAENRLQQQARR